MEREDGKRIGTMGIGEALVKAMGDLGADDPATRRGARIRHAWEQVAEETVLKHTDNIFVFKEDGQTRMVVYTDLPIWAAELNAQRERYRILMERELGSGPIHQIVFKASSRTARRFKFTKTFKAPAKDLTVTPIPATPEEFERIHREAGTISDPEIREILVKARIRDLEWKKGCEAAKRP